METRPIGTAPNATPAAVFPQQRVRNKTSADRRSNVLHCIDGLFGSYGRFRAGNITTEKADVTSETIKWFCIGMFSLNYDIAVKLTTTYFS